MSNSLFVSGLSEIAAQVEPVPPGTDLHNILYTTKLSQGTGVYLQPNQNIGMERHDDPPSDQAVLVLEGEGHAMLGKNSNDKNLDFYNIQAGSFINIPAGIRHEFYNTSEDQPMKLLIIYTPPIH